MAGFNPFKQFRSIQKYALAAVGLMAIFSFVIFPSLMMVSDDGGAGSANREVIAKLRRQSGYGNIDATRLQRFRDDNVLLREFYRSLYEEMTQVFGNTPESGVLLEPLRNLVMGSFQSDEGIVTEWMLARYAEEKGIVVTDEQISAFLNAVTNDGISTGRFLEICDRLETTEARIRHLLREALLTRNMMSLFESSLRPVTMLSAWDYYQRVHRSLSVEVAAVPVDSFVSEVRKPSQRELQHFFDENKSRVYDPAHPESGFATPSRLAFEMIEATATDELLASIPQEEIKAFYEENKSQMFLKRNESPLFPQGTTDGASPLPGMDAVPGMGSGFGSPLFSGEGNLAPSPAENGPDVNRDLNDLTNDEPTNDDAAVPSEDVPAETQPEERESGTTEQTLFPRDGSTYRAVAYRGDEGEEPVVEEPAIVIPGMESAVEETETVSEENSTDETRNETQAVEVEEAQTETTPAEEPSEVEESPVADEEIDTSILYTPLEEVESLIRNVLAQRKIEESLKVVEKEMRDYFTAYTLGVQTGNSRTDLEAFASEHHLRFHRQTQPVSLHEAQKKDYWRNDEVRQFLTGAFAGNAPIFDVVVGRDQLYYQIIAPVRYVGWVTERQAQAVPEFTDAGIEEMVEKRWYEVNARELARKQAESLADKANQSAGKTLRESLADDAVDVVDTERFTWYEPTYAGMGDSEIPYDLGEIREQGVARGTAMFDNRWIHAPGRSFMETAYALREGRAGVTFNQPETTVYVVRLIDDFPSEETLMKNFTESPAFDMSRAGLRDDKSAAARKWVEHIERYFGFEWVNRPEPVNVEGTPWDY